MHDVAQEEALMARASGADLAPIPASRAAGAGAAVRSRRAAERRNQFTERDSFGAANWS
ncbi:hypothetical protein ABT299_23915 [Spirillospora sp. NPDC000708]|jgi:hypothetical protein|uniref:hypothetical protein n=1 Tax=Actinomadura TaxID=1988 RepID=UPI001683FC09|nr:hypothetical protein [Actinomadura sp. RB99]